MCFKDWLHTTLKYLQPQSRNNSQWCFAVLKWSVKTPQFPSPIMRNSQSFKKKRKIAGLQLVSFTQQMQENTKHSDMLLKSRTTLGLPTLKLVYLGLNSQKGFGYSTNINLNPDNIKIRWALWNAILRSQSMCFIPQMVTVEK